MNIPGDLKYTNDHEWIKIDGSMGIVGITDFAQGELGDIVFIDIDPDQDEVGLGDTFGTIEAVKTVSDLFAPVSGKLVEVNEKLQDEPQLVNSDPYGDGWIAKFELTNLDELNNLMDAGAYKDQIGQ